jgi:hypothetical protein
MLWGKKVLRISAAIAVAVAAAHTAERLKGDEAQQSLLQAALEREAAEAGTIGMAARSPVPMSASLRSSTTAALGDLVGITAVSGTTEPQGGDRCRPSMQLTAVSGAMVHLALTAPCNRNERIVVRHSGLSFATRTEASGSATVLFPALKSDALVAVYLADARLVLGSVAVPEANDYSRFAIIWEWPAEVELRVTDGDKLLVGTAPTIGGDPQRVMSLGRSDVQSPVMAHVYSVPGKTLGPANLTGELRITPASCGRTLRFDTVHSAAGDAEPRAETVAVPLCGTAGDILVLKNLVAPLTLDPPK